MQRFIIVIVSVLVFVFLVWGSAYFYSQGRTYEVKTVPFFKDQLEVIAHRGGALEMPENTIQAFEYATSLSPDVILEFDVHLTSDKKVVVFHDTLLNRTTNGDGPIHTKTLEELKQLDAAFNFENQNGDNIYRGKGFQIPTLDEVLEKFPDSRMIIEIKPNSIDAAVATFEVIAKYQRLNKTLIGSEHSPIVKYIKFKNPDMFITAGKDEILRSVMLENMSLERLDSMNADAYCIPEKHDGIKVLSPGLLAELKRRGKKTYIWTVNSTDDMARLIQFGVDGIITDRPKELLELLRAPSQI